MSLGMVLAVSVIWWGACIGAYFAWARFHLARTARRGDGGAAR
jgi:hypothetical protein